MGAARTSAPLAPRPGPVDQWRKEAPIRLLKLATDEVLVQDVRGGSERAFKVIYERYQLPILAFCRHMLGSHEEAEDAVQQTFISAYRDMLRDGKELNLRPWLYRIARNHCISAIRKRRPVLELGDREPSTIGLPAQVESRGELRALLGDLARLPESQREALLLTELESNSHAEVAEILGCDRERVKSLVFQARKALMNSREARELPCREVRKRLGVVRGAGLRRGALGRHLRTCEDCRAFEREVRVQRQQLAVLLVVTPSAALKLCAANAIAAAGGGGNGAGGAVGSGAGNTASSAGPVGSAAGSASSFSPGLVGGAAGIGSTATAVEFALPAMLVKGAATVVAVGVLATGAAVGAQRVAERVRAAGSPPAQGISSPASPSLAQAPAPSPPGLQRATSTDAAPSEGAPSSPDEDSAGAGAGAAGGGQAESSAPATPETSPPASPAPTRPLAAPRLQSPSVHAHLGLAHPFHRSPPRGRLGNRPLHLPPDYGRAHGRPAGRQGGIGPKHERSSHRAPKRGHSPGAGLPERSDQPGQQHAGKPSPVTPKPTPPGQSKPPGTPANPEP
jgi:RNA polymerase sigma factor (sigma-70 family)